MSVVAGIDVGGARKGFHAVALRDGVYLGKFAACDAVAVADWCLSVGARIIGVDAPCRWSLTGRARSAERGLMAAGIWCFSTPTIQAAIAHPRNHFGWMLTGAALFQQLAATHALFNGTSPGPVEQICFETFPQAIACALSGGIVSAKAKRTVRRDLLRSAGIDTRSLTNVDTLDAALCALTAHHLANGDFRSYGEAETGFIVVPRMALPATASQSA